MTALASPDEDRGGVVWFSMVRVNVPDTGGDAGMRSFTSCWVSDALRTKSMLWALTSGYACSCAHLNDTLHEKPPGICSAMANPDTRPLQNQTHETAGGHATATTRGDRACGCYPCSTVPVPE